MQHALHGATSSTRPVYVLRPRGFVDTFEDMMLMIADDGEKEPVQAVDQDTSTVC